MQPSWKTILQIMDEYKNQQATLRKVAGKGGWNDPDVVSIVIEFLICISTHNLNYILLLVISRPSSINLWSVEGSNGRLVYYSSTVNYIDRYKNIRRRIQVYFTKSRSNSHQPRPSWETGIHASYGKESWVIYKTYKNQSHFFSRFYIDNMIFLSTRIR